MSISRKDFERGNFQVRHDDLNTHPVRKFLEKNRNTAYTAKEVAKGVNKGVWGVRQVLLKLRRHGIVKHKTPYFIVVNKRKK